MKFEPTLHKLSNGVTVILDPMDVATDEVCICFRTGAGDEEPHEYGITHFCEHMFCKGTPRFPTVRAGKDYIAYNGGSFNASTSLDYLKFVGRIVSENLWVLLDFLADRIQNSLFDTNMIENERGVILDELRRSLSKNGVKQTMFVEKKLYDIEVPNGEMTLGNPENIKSFTREQMLEFASRRMSSKNCLICVSGKIADKNELLKKLEDRFNLLPTHIVEKKRRWQYRACTAHNLMPEIKNDVIEILFPCLWPATLENKYQDTCVSKFEQKLRETMYDVLRSDNGLVYGCGFSNRGDIFSPICGPYTETAPENVARVVALIAKAAHDVYVSGVTEDDLRKYKNLSKLSRANFLENNYERCRRNVLDWGYFNIAHDFYRDCEMADSVTCDDVMKYTRGIYDGPMSIITHGPKFDGDLQQIWKDNFK